MLIKQETLLEGGAQAESSRAREPRRTALPHGSQSRALGERASFPACLWPVTAFGPRSDSGSFRVARASLSQDGGQRKGFWGLAASRLPPLTPPQGSRPGRGP